VGLTRPGLEEVEGEVAVLLWHDYRSRRNARALETLLAYNACDTVSLHALMVHAHNEKVRATPFAGSHLLKAPTLPAIPFEPDRATLARVLNERAVSGGWSPWSYPRRS
jgi:hypothetical protein